MTIQVGASEREDWLRQATARVLREEMGYSRTAALTLVYQHDLRLRETLETLPRKLAMELERIETRGETTTGERR